MTDNKLTDNEIIKGIECCASRTFRCDECCYAPFKFNECTPHILNDALDLINRQNAEIERLKDLLSTDFVFIGRTHGKTKMVNQMIRVRVDEIKAEAFKELAEELKKQYPNKYVVWGGGAFGITFDEFVDQVVKEMEDNSNV